MYKVLFYDHDIFDDQLQELFPAEESVLERDVNTAGKLSMTLPKYHPNYDKLQKLKLGVIVKKKGKVIFKGRIYRDSNDFYGSKSIECEGKLAVFNDSIQRPYEFAGSPREYFALLINNHNSMVDDEKKFIVGNITISDPNDYIARSSTDYKSSWELIKNLIDTLGGYLFIRYEEDGDYIDWLEDFPYTNKQKIAFAENLLDIITETTSEETYTACIPLGATISEEDDSAGMSGEGQKRLTVESVNDGSDVVYDVEKVKEYGWKFAPTDKVTWDDVTRPENLLSKAKEWLNQQGLMLASSIEITAADLSYMDKAVAGFEWLQYVQIESEPHGIDQILLLSKMKEDMLYPENGKINLGYSQRTLYDSFQKSKGTGTPGPPGDNGKSAYEIWLEAGNSGTEEEYLESLKGEAGTSVKSMTRYYLLQDSSLEAPEKPTEYPPSSMWETTEPEYDADSDSSLYRVECTLYSDGTWQYTDVSLSSDYESVKSVNEKIDSIDAALHEEIIEQSSYILRTGKEITMGILAGYTTVSDLKTYKKQIENLFSTSEEGFSMEFNQLSQELDKIGGKISDQSQYIRFIEGVIYIGRTDSLITAEFTNDELRFMYNGHPVATFTSEALKVNSIYIENQLAYFDKWATRKGAYIEGKGYNLTDIWIGG